MLSFETDDGPLALAPTRCIIAGWSGRDAAAVAHHIEELAAIGVPRPSTTPLYYEVPAALLVQPSGGAGGALEIQALGAETGGEIEPVLVDDGQRLWLTLGSDHTDRALEATSVAHSKAVCAKPLAARAWPLERVSDRLDSLVFQSWISDDGADWTPYQDGVLAQVRPLPDLIGGAPTADGPQGRLGAGVVMFGGTFAAIGGVRPTPWLKLRLSDPVGDDAIELAYHTRVLPVVA